MGSSPRGRIRDEVPGPDVATIARPRRKTSGSASPHDLALGWRHSQPLGPAQLLHMSLAHRPAFPAQQRCDPPVAIARMLFRKFPQPLGQPLFRRRGISPSVPPRRPRQLQEPARCSPGAHPSGDGFSRHRSPMFRAQNFFFAHKLQHPVFEQRLKQALASRVLVITGTPGEFGAVALRTANA